MRTVNVASRASNRPVILENFAGTTWAELREELENRGAWKSNLEAIVRETKVTLQRDEAVLPEGSFTIYLVETKNAAGMSSADAETLGAQISQAIYRAASVASEEEVQDLKNRLITEIADFFNVNEDQITDDVAEITPAEPLSAEEQRIMDEMNEFLNS